MIQFSRSRGEMRGRWFVALAALLAFALVFATLAQSSIGSVALVGALCGVVAVAVLPPTVAVVGWGMLLPLYSVGSLSSSLFDAARLITGIVLILRLPPVGGRAARLRQWMTPMGVLATYTLLIGVCRPDPYDRTLGLMMLVALVLTGLVIARIDNVWALAAGLVLGCVASSLVLILQANGMVPLAASQAQEALIGRYAGLSSSSTRVSGELALATLVSLEAFIARRRGRILWLLVCLPCVAGILMSGARTGLAVLAVGLVVILVNGWLTLGQTIGAVGLIAAVGAWVVSNTGTLSTIQRFTPTPGAPAVDFTTGRLNLDASALATFFHHPVFGTGQTSFLLAHGHTAHFPPLLFATSSGVVGFVIATGLELALCICIARRMRRRPSARGLSILAGLAVYAFLEPLGPWVGVEMNCILFVGFVLLGSRASSKNLVRSAPNRIDRVGYVARALRVVAE